MRTLLVLCLALLLVLPACASGGGGGEDDTVAPANSVANGASGVAASEEEGKAGREGTAGPSPSRWVIGQAELETVQSLSALQAIERLRRPWLSTRGPVSLDNQDQAGIKVYLDGSPRGGMEQLATMRANQLSEIRFLNSREATMRFGTGHPDGAILLVSKSGNPR